MNRNFPQPTFEQLVACRKRMQVDTPPSLHNPQMWEDLRQAMYEAHLYLRRKSRQTRNACLRRHARRNRVRAQPLREVAEREMVLEA